VGLLAAGDPVLFEEAQMMDKQRQVSVGMAALSARVLSVQSQFIGADNRKGRRKAAASLRKELKTRRSK
jgi:hypothetical protein